jgi:hypothetical protein
MSPTDDNEPGYSITISRTVADGTEENFTAGPYGLLRELLDDVERMAEDRGWFDADEQQLDGSE